MNRVFQQNYTKDFLGEILDVFLSKNPGHMTEVKSSSKFFKIFQEVFLHISVMLTASWKTLYHRVMKSNKKSPNGLLSRFSNRSYCVDLF